MKIFQYLPELKIVIYFKSSYVFGLYVTLFAEKAYNKNRKSEIISGWQNQSNTSLLIK